MTDHPDQDEMVRAEFEAWAHKSPANLAKDAAGGYQSATVAFAWRAVQAVTQRQQERIAYLQAIADGALNHGSQHLKRIAELEADAARYQFATSHNDEGRLNFKAIYDAWDGDGSFTDQIDAARATHKEQT